MSALHSEDAIEAYFLGRLTEHRAHEALFDHLAVCRECRASFDQMALALREFEGTSEISEAELAVLSAHVSTVSTVSTTSNVANVSSVSPSRVPEVRASVRRAFSAPLEAVMRWGDRLRRRPALRALALAAPMAVGVSLFVLQRPEPTSDPEVSTLTAKGAPVLKAASSGPTVEVLCFDDAANVVRHLVESGRCPAPGFVKVVHASTASHDRLTIAVLEGDTLVFREELVRPSPRTVVPAHAKLARGTVLRVVVTEKAGSTLEELRGLPSSLVITGEE